MGEDDPRLQAGKPDETEPPASQPLPARRPQPRKALRERAGTAPELGSAGPGAALQKNKPQSSAVWRFVVILLLVWCLLATLLILTTYFFLLPGQPQLPTDAPIGLIETLSRPMCLVFAVL